MKWTLIGGMHAGMALLFSLRQKITCFVTAPLWDFKEHEGRTRLRSITTPEQRQSKNAHPGTKPERASVGATRRSALLVSESPSFNKQHLPVRRHRPKVGRDEALQSIAGFANGGHRRDHVVLHRHGLVL